MLRALDPPLNLDKGTAAGLDAIRPVLTMHLAKATSDPHTPGAAGATGVALREWIEVAQRVEQAHRLTVAWIRSRLPNYPIIRAPQLARHTTFTTDEFTWQLGWPIQDQRIGLQATPAPPSVGEELNAEPGLVTNLTTTTKEIAKALSGTQEWATFAAAASNLDKPAKQNLRAARRTLAERLSPKAVDDHEAKIAVTRSNYRAHVLAEVLDPLSGSALDYAESFGAV